jgi:phage terminase large subunit
MFDIIFKIISFFKSLVFHTANKDESNFFSKSFNFRKWLLFIFLIFFFLSTIFLIFKLFSISARYLVLKRDLTQQQVVLRLKETKYNKYIKEMRSEEGLISTEHRLIEYYQAYNRDMNISQKNHLLILDSVTLLNVNNTLLLSDIQKLNRIQIELKTIMEKNNDTVKGDSVH